MAACFQQAASLLSAARFPGPHCRLSRPGYKGSPQALAQCQGFASMNQRAQRGGRNSRLSAMNPSAQRLSSQAICKSTWATRGSMLSGPTAALSDGLVNTRLNSASLGVVPSAEQAAAKPAGMAAFEDTNYQHSAKVLNNLVNDMRDVGAHFELDLPTVVVCGNQSAGKSSLLEALSGITFPRNAGTCTRCPCEVRMKSSGDFSCTIKLRRELKNGGASSVEEVPFGASIQDASHIELGIRRAQKALLNPGTDASTFLEYDFSGQEEANELQFTQDVVVLTLSGGPSDLTLIDLPGIIRNTESDEDRHYIPLIQDLVRQYIKKDNAIIVATVTCSDDIANQEVVKLAKEVDPNGARTLGVLTKADRIAEGEEGQRKNVVEGGSFKLNLGWHVVCNPNQTQLEQGISFAAAREAERSFFAATPVWRDTAIQSQLGVDNLRSSLSKHLVRLIQRALPGMMQEGNKKLDGVRKELDDMPPELSHPRVEYNKLSNMLEQAVKHTLMASKEGDKQDYGDIFQTFETFAEKVNLTKPVFRLEKDGTVKGDSSFDFILVASDGSGDDLVTASNDSDAETVGMGANAGRMIIGTKDVAEIIQKERGRQIPGCIPYSALTALIHQYQDSWADLVDACFDQVAKQGHMAALKHVDAIFRGHPEMQLIVRAHLDNVHSELSDTTKQRLAELVQRESALFTLNNHYMLESREKFEAQLRKEWVTLHFNAPDDSRLRQAVSFLTSASDAFAGATITDLYKCSVPNKDVPVIEMMATAMAYLKVATKCFADEVPMSINSYLLDRLPAALAAKLQDELQQLDNNIDELMLEDVNLTRTRTTLQGRRKTLSQLRFKLMHLRL